MTASRISTTVAFFCCIGASHYLFEPAYNGYLIAFAILIAATLGKRFTYPRGTPLSGFASTVLTVLLLMTILMTAGNGADWRDILRDCGVFLAFAIGRFVLPAWVGTNRVTDLLQAMSLLGVVDALLTLLGAALAYRAGASAYEWRGAYVPVFHNWIPYLLLSNVALLSLKPHRRGIYWSRIALCVLATLASLSRTDLLLYMLFAAAMLASKWRLILSSPRRIAATLCAFLALATIVYASLGLDVVQQRVDRGVGDEDQSLGWRLIEDLALFDHLDEHGMANTLLGFGWGARLPLPDGVTDFDGNDSIPLLHNSFLTVVLKFGVIGLSILLLYIARRLMSAWRSKDPASRPLLFMGAWMLFFNAADAITLQGLTEWSQVMFFGIGCFLISARPKARPVAEAAPQMQSLSPPTSLDVPRTSE